MFRLSQFQAVMKGLSRGFFDAQVRQHRGDRYSKGFGCWDLLVAMVFGQLSGASSLRQLEAGFNAQHAHHYHLGTRALRRSTLADACGKRPIAIFEATVRQLMTQVGRKHRQHSAELLYLLDSTSITLKGPGFDGWTQASRTRRTQGLKLHLLLDAHTQAPISQSMTLPNVNDVTEGRRLSLEPGATYVFDKGYCDYQWWSRFDAQGAVFITRFKRNARLEVIEQQAIPAEDRSWVLADETVRLSNRHPSGGRRNPYTQPLRRITVGRDDQPPLVLATNDLTRPAADVAARYRDRWQVELFFKWIKQHLRIKQFLGRSENAVRLQILCALIAYLLLVLYRKACGSHQSLWHFLGAIKVSLFQRPQVEAMAAERRRRDRSLIAATQGVLFA